MAAVRRRGSRLPLVIGAFCVIAVIAAAFFILNPPYYEVDVNGNPVSVRAGSTLQDLIDEDVVSPSPGNLIAVDGTVATKGGGSAFTATVNGAKTADPSTKLVRDAVVTVGDGEDVEETFTESTSPLPYGQSSTEATLNAYFLGAFHLYSSGVDGEQLTRTGDVSGRSVRSVSRQPVNAGFSVGHADVGDEKVIALTFDDGPWPDTTEEICEILEENGAHATFFTIGEQIQYYGEPLKRLHQNGNQIATHTYDHAEGSGQGVNLTYMSEQEQVSEVTKGFSAIEEALGAPVSKVLRAPGGNYYGSIVDTLSPYVDVEVGWDVDTKDWSRPGVDAIVERIMSAEPGDVILCHDGGGERSQTVEAIRMAIPQMIERGYRFVTIDELMSYGVEATMTAE